MQTEVLAYRGSETLVLLLLRHAGVTLKAFAFSFWTVLHIDILSNGNEHENHT